jgi:hypothetical protein
MAFNNEIERVKAQIFVLEKKLALLEEVEKQPRMNLQQEGEYAVVSFNDKVYYRLQGDVTFSWYIKKGVNVGYPVPTLMMVNDAETERLLEGLYYNHIQVKKETAQEPEEPNIFTPKEIEELIKEGLEWCEDHSNENPLDWVKPQTPEPSMTNCIITGNPPIGYSSWSDWYNELGSKCILNNLRISSKDYEPTPQTPEETEQSLKEAFVKAQQTEKWKEIQKLIDEEDNDKNFKNSLDLIKEWGEKNKPKTLYQICMEWWNEVFVNQMDDDICVDVLVSKIDKEFIPPSSKRNTYEWEKCLKIMRDKLR